VVRGVARRVTPPQKKTKCGDNIKKAYGVFRALFVLLVGINAAQRGNAFSMTTSKAFKLFFTRATDFGGRSTRKEFWLGVLPNAIIMLALIGLTLFAWLGTDSLAFRIASIVALGIFCLVELLPSLSLISRRMHDVGKSGKYIFVLLIPVFGFVWYLYLVTRPTDCFVKQL